MKIELYTHWLSTSRLLMSGCYSFFFFFKQKFILKKRAHAAFAERWEKSRWNTLDLSALLITFISKYPTVKPHC